MSNALVSLLLVFTLSVTSAAARAPAPKDRPAPRAPNYFPCELGTKWEYESKDEVTVHEITKVRHETDCKYVTFTLTQQKTGVISQVRYRVTKDAVYEEVVDRATIYEVMRLQLPLKEKMKWEATGPFAFGDGTTTEVRAIETVKVLAGEFQVINVVTLVKGLQENQLKFHHQYADGIGRVQILPSIPGGPAIVLKKFTPPPE